MRYLLTPALLLALAAETRACDYGAAAFSYGYSAPVQQFYAPQQFVVPQGYYAPTIPLQFGYSAPLGVQSYSLSYSSPFVQSYGYSSPLAISTGYGRLGLGVNRVRVSPFGFRAGFGRSRVIIR